MPAALPRYWTYEELKKYYPGEDRAEMMIEGAKKFEVFVDGEKITVYEVVITALPVAAAASKPRPQCPSRRDRSNATRSIRRRGR